jgi:ABC-2 type transport system permease protein
MNVFLREMKSHWKGLLFWCLGMFAMVAAGMAKYAAYKGAGQSVAEMMKAIPKGVATVLGISGFDLTTAKGFYGVLFLYVAIMAAVHAALLGAQIISEEERDRTSEFLYTKPITRSGVLTRKLAAALVNLVVLNLVTLVSSMYYVSYFSKGEDFTGYILLLMAGMGFMQLIFLSVGALMAGTTHRPKAAPSLSTSFMFLTFVISAFVGMNDKLSFLKYLTPFKYFDAAVLYNHPRMDPVFVVLSIVIIVGSIAGTYRFYAARDLAV